VIEVKKSLGYGVPYILPMLPAFLPHLPLIRADWRFETWRVDLIAEGYHAAIGGDIELTFWYRRAAAGAGARFVWRSDASD
jgi:DNA-binding transcriptional LysR family regulator